MKTPYLIQRISEQTSYNKEIDPNITLDIDKDGILNKNALRKLDSLMRNDYMGASEFEWGALGKAWTFVAQRRADLVPFEMQFEGQPYQTWVIPQGKVRKKLQDWPARKVNLYGFCPKEFIEEYPKMLNDWAKENYKGYFMKCYPRMKDSLFPEQSYSMRTYMENKDERYNPFKDNSRVVAWLDFDSPAFFTVRQGLYKEVSSLFGVGK